MYDDNWYKNLKKSPLNPPPWVFGVVWPILYFMILVSVILVIREKPKGKVYRDALFFFTMQILFNLIWMPIFFGLHEIRVALVDIYLTIIFTILTIYFFYKINKVSSWLLVPYLLWLGFASYLNLYIVLNN